ncbi:MAG: O-antigen ligase family protein [Thermodesulfovibrionales bacterium]
MSTIKEITAARLKNIAPDDLIYAGLCGMFFFITLGNSPVEICGVFILGIWIVSGRIFTDIPAWLRSGMALPVSALFLLPWIGLTASPSLPEGFRVASKTYFWFYAVALVSVLRGRKDREMFLTFFLAGLAVNALVSILQYAGAVPLKHGLPSGLLGISSPWITYSLLLTLGIVIASFYYKRAGSASERTLYILAILLYLVPIGFVGGRSGYLAFALLSPLVISNLLGRRHFIVIAGGSILAVSLLFVSPVVQSRLAKVQEDLTLYQQGTVYTSIGLRLHMWKITLSAIKEHPFTGIGTAGFKKTWEERKGDPALPTYDHPHNSFLYVMVSFGITGLVALCWLFFVMLKRGWQRMDSAPGFSVFVFTVILIIGSLTDTQIQPFPTATALALFAGVAGALDA